MKPYELIEKPLFDVVECLIFHLSYSNARFGGTIDSGKRRSWLSE